MKHLMLCMLALAALPGSALQAQNITGAWQGTLELGPQKLRVVFQISLDNDKLKAMLYSIDQQGSPLPASTVTKDGSTVKIAIGGVGGYEGKLSADGNSMTGSFTQGAALPLNLTRATPDLFPAFQQQLGLKLESTKAQADVMVIDKVEKPSGN